MTAGALSLSSKRQLEKTVGPRAGAHAIFLPFDEGEGTVDDGSASIEEQLDTLSEAPAAVVLETIQAEGGVIVGRNGWLKAVGQICQERGILLIVDDVQMGCGRTGPFFSFERAGLRPDFIILSKSVGAFGIPLSVVLLKADLDAWEPGEHTGTFRGQNLAFVAGRLALDHYWSTAQLESETAGKALAISSELRKLWAECPRCIRSVRGEGLFFGIEFDSGDHAGLVASNAFARGLLMERAGPDRAVLKISPPLIISPEALAEGLARLADAVRACFTTRSHVQSS
jgi:diaminobutyrate-2-oxoglutarate transaminase